MREIASPAVSRVDMKTLSITPSRWFRTVFEVPVLRRIPRCREAFPDPAQPAPTRRLRQLQTCPARRCAHKRSLVGQTT